MPKRVQPAKQLTESQAAYLAGIVDGEGRITATLNRGYINGCLEIGSVNKEFLENLRGMVGTGTLCAKGRRSKNAKAEFPSVVNKTDGFQLEAIDPFRTLNRRDKRIACN